MSPSCSLPSLALLVVAVSSLAPAPQPRAAHDVDHFTTSEQCAVCHTAAPGATAMLAKDGQDISPYGLWQGTMMANAFRDPYFRAQLRKETAAAGEAVQELCLRCHAPMLHHEARMNGKALPRLADAENDLLADDSVSCTVCHTIEAKGLGEAATFSGLPNFNQERKIFGPFADVATRPMQNMVRYTPTQGEHIRKAALCGSCHTLFTEHHGTPFPEQTPYLEWRNSQFSDENGKTEQSRTCQECHMAASDATRIARTPMGFDFNIPAREGYRQHAFVGGNAFMLGILDRHRDDLDVLAESSALQHMAELTRTQLAQRTARIALSPVAVDAGTGKFTVTIENLTGHKFPTGYPARRAWLHVAVQDGDKTLFEVGAYDGNGRIAGIPDELALPHVDVVRRAEDVVVYEMSALDPEGKPTTYLTKMVERRKDNRLLPKGWDPKGPHVSDTGPVGIGADVDFTGGGDVVHFEVPLPAAIEGKLQVVAHLYYQTVPPAWVDSLRGIAAEECERFVRYYDAADKTPERVAEARWRAR